MAWQGTVTYRTESGTHTVAVGFPDDDLEDLEQASAWFADNTPSFVPGAEFVSAALEYVPIEDYPYWSRPRRHRGRHRP